MKEFTRRMLENKGWTHDRSIDCSSNIAYLEERGWRAFSSAIQFIKNYDNLGEFNGHILEDFHTTVNPFTLNSRLGYSWRKEAEKVEEYTKVSLFPIGYQNLSCLFVSSDDSLYAIDADVTFYRIGNTIDESLDNLFEGKFIKESLTYL